MVASNLSYDEHFLRIRIGLRQYQSGNQVGLRAMNFSLYYRSIKINPRNV